MALLTWKDEYSVGVKQFDDEHKRLIGLINDLHAAMLASRSQEVVQDVLRKLVQYTDIHFRHEEETFAKAGYPESAQHKAQHNTLRAQVMEFVHDGREHNAHLSIDVLKFLKQWLLDHIEKNDKAYGPFLNAKGIK